MLKTNINTFLGRLKYYLLSLLFAIPRLRVVKRLLLGIGGKVSKVDFKQIFYVFNKDVGWIYVDGSRYYVYLWKYKFEKDVTNLVKKLSSRHKGLFVDIGAYIGFYSIMLAKRGWDVIAFDPNPISFKLLKLNISAHKVKNSIVALMIAAGSEERLATLTLSLTPSESSFTNYLRKEFRLAEMNVPVIPLDKIINSLSSKVKSKDMMLLKVDVEGFGLEVIRGAFTIIKTFKPYIIFEVHRTFDEKDELKSIKMLKELGYKYKVLEYKSNGNFILFLYPDQHISTEHLDPLA